MISVDVLIQTAIVLAGMIGVYWWGYKKGFHEGVNGMAETLVALEIVTKEDLQKLLDVSEDLDE